MSGEISREIFAKLFNFWKGMKSMKFMASTRGGKARGAAPLEPCTHINQALIYKVTKVYKIRSLNIIFLERVNNLYTRSLMLSNVASSCDALSAMNTIGLVLRCGKVTPSVHGGKVTPSISCFSKILTKLNTHP